MSEITKLYENAEIKKQIPKVCSSNELYCKECDAHIEDAMPYCKNAEYPPFTAEKQIAILQFCLKWGQVHILQGIDDEYRIENSCYRQGYQPTIADAIANYINEKWEKLTPEEKQQVKGILEVE